MDHSVNTNINDAVTNRQLTRFVVNVQIPPRWKSKVNVLEDVLQMPVIYQDNWMFCLNIVLIYKMLLNNLLISYIT